MFLIAGHVAALRSTRVTPVNAAGKPAVLRITLDDGQAYDFRREAK